MTKTPADPAALATDLVQAVVQQEVQAMHLLQAEMEVLARVAVAAVAPAVTPLPTEAETEAGFDNMPV